MVIIAMNRGSPAPSPAVLVLEKWGSAKFERIWWDRAAVVAWHYLDIIFDIIWHHFDIHDQWQGMAMGKNIRWWCHCQGTSKWPLCEKVKECSAGWILWVSPSLVSQTVFVFTFVFALVFMYVLAFFCMPGIVRDVIETYGWSPSWVASSGLILKVFLTQQLRYWTSWTLKILWNMLSLFFFTDAAIAHLPSLSLTAFW